jgi:hypothetical protein
MAMANRTKTTRSRVNKPLPRTPARNIDADRRTLEAVIERAKSQRAKRRSRK